MSKEKQVTKLCKHCKTEIPKDAKICPNCRKKQGGIGKWIVIGIVVILLITIGKGGGDKKNDASDAKSNKTQDVAESSVSKDTSTPTPEEKDETESSPAVTDEPTVTEDPSVPTEYISALNKATTYSDVMHMSKAAIYEQLTSEYGEQFAPEAAQYAVDNMVADWNANALSKAEEYSNTAYMSKAGIYDQLVSEYGEQFTEEEAQYAIDNIQADWNTNALEKAKTYQDMDMSPNAIYDQLTSEYGEKFTTDEAQYAIDNLS